MRSKDGQYFPDKEKVLEDGKAGEVRFYRIFEAIPLPRDRNKRGDNIGNTNFEKKKVIGYAPVSEDGSVSMEVPANKSLHMQSLDLNGMMLVNQNTWVQVMPGEKRICTGCHGAHEKDQIIFDMVVSADLSVKDTARQVLFKSGFQNTVNILTFSPNGDNFIPVTNDTLDFYSTKNANTVQNVFENKCNSCHGAEAATKGGSFSLLHTGMITGNGMDGEGTSKLYHFLTETGNYKNTGKEYVTRLGARKSPLIWVMYNKQLGGVDGYKGSTFDHSTLWTKADGRVNSFHPDNKDLLKLIEWIDMGIQYSNTTGYKGVY